VPTFIPGLELSRRFYEEAVRPILDRAFPDLLYAAGRLGWGSDVLGFDDETSTDHNWGPIVQLFLREDDIGRAEAIREVMERELPETFAGYPVRFLPADTGRPPEHWIVPLTLVDFIGERLGFDPTRTPDAADWLTFPSQRLLAITGGAVHHDGVGALTALRQTLAYYPEDVWRYLLAATWQRIGQEGHLMPRAGQAGDELGSALIGSRLVRDAMRLAFLLERRYAPYAKWFGTAFARLACAPALTSPLWRTQLAPTWPERQAALNEALGELVRRQNTLGLTRPLPESASSFYGRPFLVIYGEDIALALLETIVDPDVKRIAQRRPIGGIDLISDNTDLLEVTDWRPALRRLYE
jgi:hypothetical protein